MANENIPRRYTTAILNAMSAGVVPHIGLEYIAVGRKREIETILSDLETVADGGGAFRLVVGQYGSGKSFLLQLARNNALQRNYLVADADLSPECRLTGTKGQGLKTYQQLIANLSTKARPNGSALESILQLWLEKLDKQIQKDGITQDDAKYSVEMEYRVKLVAAELQEYLYGYDFAKVLLHYWHGFRDGNAEAMQNALRWIRGDYARKGEAKELGVSQIIGDDTWYECIKLLALLAVKLGYQGLIILLDEEVNLYKITNRVSRENNYEKLLTIFNDLMQGRANHLAVYVGGTHQSVEDERRGLFSYEALKSRLAASKLPKRGNLVDLTGPIMPLQTLEVEEIYLLLERLMTVFSAHYKLETPPLTEEQLVAFLSQVSGRLGADQLLTPREVTRDFLTVLNLLRQNPEETFESLTAAGKAKIEAAPENPDNSEFAEFNDL